MNKEEVRQKMLDIVGDMFNADSNKITIGMPHVFDGHTWQEAKDTINTAFDGLEPDHQKVKLPRDVGEELEDWLKTDNIDDILDKIVCIYDGDHSVVRNWWASTLGATYLIADMARYGWEAEPEELFYVKVPDSWKMYGGGLNWLYKRSYSCGIDICSHTGESDEQFTRAELKHYHLDSDIFTLVPVGEEK